MLSFKFVTSAAGAAHYFEAADDYYGQEGHRGEWIGQGVSDLGLDAAAAIDRATFQNLLDGQLPDGRRIRSTQTRASKDRKGIDFTFSAPKSVSIQALVKEDSRLVAAHDLAVRRSLDLMESFVAARRKQSGLSFRERTGKMVAATFRHELSRAQDPQLHTHAIVLNLTCRGDGQWRALSNEDMLRNVKVVGAFYRATLATELRKLGLQLRETRKGGWELAHISDAAIQHFSQRSQEIERLLAARGQDRGNASTAQKQIITLASRQKKTESDRAWLRAHWLATARDAGIDLNAQAGLMHQVSSKATRVAMALRTVVKGQDHGREAANHAINFAVAHLAERQGIFSRAEVLEVAYGRAATQTTTGSVDAALDLAAKDGRLLPELPLYQTARSLNLSAGELAKDPSADRFKGHDEFEKLTRASWIALTMVARQQSQAQAEATVDSAITRGALVAAEIRFATPQARRSEIRLLGIEKAGRGAVPPIATATAAEALLQGAGLNAGQRDAVVMVLTAQDRFVGIQGLAGTGKSHMLSRAVAGIQAETAKLSERQGYRVIGLAPYASQNEALSRLGMASQTLASFLARVSEQRRLDERAIVFLDEAGVVPAHQLEQLMAIIERQRARLVLVGDREQTHAVEAGKPFEQLQDAGMTKAYLTEIQRQVNPEIRAAVVHAARHEVPNAVQVLRHAIIEVRQDAQRHARLAEAYVRLPAAERQETLIVAGTNDARRAINALVRKGLALPDGHPVELLHNVDMTRAELRSAQSYEAGQLLVPQRSYGQSLRQGEQLKVLGHDLQRNTLTAARADGGSVTFDPARQSMLRVYQKESAEIAVGDWVRVTANDKATGLCNGDRCRVIAVEAAALVLRKEGREGTPSTDLRIDRGKPMHLQHAYATTVHSAQGLTKNRVLVDANTKSLTSNRAVFYVAISRPRNDITLFTDDAGRLAAAMSREPKKFAALELRDATLETRVLRSKMDRFAALKLAAQLRRKPMPPPGLTGRATVQR
ncbi:MAG: conjugative relaxase [Comamonadaceae bacterium]|nr:MAG: conjugative relaxase [Comamonadaceae bacterium]